MTEDHSRSYRPRKGLTICMLSEFRLSYFNEGFYLKGISYEFFFSLKESLEMQVINHLTPMSN